MPGDDRDAGIAPERLKLRSDFVAAAKGVRVHARTFSIQSPVQAADGKRPPRFGYTVTKKVGVAVVRNRIRRRLREAVRLLTDNPAHSGRDYVIFARREALHAGFQELTEDLRRAIDGVNAAAAARAQRRTRPHTDTSGASSKRSHRQAGDQDQAIPT